MNAEALSRDDESFLDEVFDLSVQSRGTGEAIDLDALLAGREHLRAHTTRVLQLAHDVAVGALPSRPAAGSPAIAGFEILGEVGRGGMGIVYRARQQSLDRIVALKILAPSLLSSSRARERFVIEARALGRVRHPNVVAVHEVIAQDELCAYAMEWVEGTTLAKAIAAHDPRLDVAALAHLGIQIARALAAVHAAGLVHRDVKPSNILLRQDGTPVLSDFSLVHDVEHSVHTATGEFLGTAAYAAPEQLRGEHDRVGAWTDVYALGVTLYSALAGRTPFAATSTAEMLRRIETGAGTPIRKLAPRVPRDFATVVQKAMERDPARRYQTAADLADDLQRFSSFEPIHARPAGLALRLQRWLERSPQLALALAGLLLTLVLGLGVSLYLAVNLAAERDAARAAEAIAERESRIQTEVTFFMRSVFRHGDPSTSTGAADMTVREALQRVSEERLGRGSHTPEVESAIRMAVADTMLSIGLIEPAAKHLTAALELRRQAFGADSKELAETAHSLGRVLRLAGRIDDAERSLRDAVRIRRARVLEPGVEPFLAQSLTSLGIVLRHQERFAEAEAAYDEAIAIYRRQFGEQDENVAILLNTKATLQTSQGRWQEAEANAHRALEIITAFHAGRPHLDVAAVGFNVGRIRCALGRPDDGERRMRDALEMTRSLVGTTHRASAEHACTLGVQLRKRGQTAEAEQLLREGLAAYDLLKMADHADAHRIELADLLVDSDRALEAETLLLPIVGRAVAAKTVHRSLRRLGVARTRLARFADAEADLNRAWSMLGASSEHADDRRACAAAMAALYEAWSAAEPSGARAASAVHWGGVRDAAR